MPSNIPTSSIATIAETINKKRRAELFKIYDTAGHFKALEYIRSQHVFDKGNKSKSMRKLASYPIYVDEFFTKVYGKDYYKDPDFFVKYAPEWLVVDSKHI
jgi:hypothetical protein